MALAIGILACAAGAEAQTAIARLALPEQPQPSADTDQETLALQLAETMGFACRGHEMWRWAFPEDDFPRAQTIVNAGERAFRERGYAVTLLPVEIDTVTAMRAQLSVPGAAADPAARPLIGPGGSTPGAAGASDANVLALWYVGERGVDLTLCRVRER